MSKLFSIYLFVACVSASAGEFEKLGSAVARVLGSSKAQHRTIKEKNKKHDIFFLGDGKKIKYAVIEKAIYDPNCTHTWVIGLDSDVKVSTIRVVEMSCAHAYPCKESTFLEQYQGKGPADVKKLKGDIATIAKATGSSDLTSDAVIHSITLVNALKSKL